MYINGNGRTQDRRNRFYIGGPTILNCTGIPRFTLLMWGHIIGLVRNSNFDAKSLNFRSARTKYF